jgi:hypothetical protein
MKGPFQNLFASIGHASLRLMLIDHISVDIGNEDAQVVGTEVYSDEIPDIVSNLQRNRPSPKSGMGRLRFDDKPFSHKTLNKAGDKCRAESCLSSKFEPGAIHSGMNQVENQKFSLLQLLGRVRPSRLYIRY